ncbi:MAG: hypothetical protein ACJ70Y_02275, partial [Nitrososphaera sp.]
MTYKTRMQSFAQFVYRRYNKTPVDDFWIWIKTREDDAYDILTKRSGSLRNESPNKNMLTADVTRAHVKTAVEFFRFSRIIVIVEDFNELVPLPRKEQAANAWINKALDKM